MGLVFIYQGHTYTYRYMSIGLKESERWILQTLENAVNEPMHSDEQTLCDPGEALGSQGETTGTASSRNRLA